MMSEQAKRNRNLRSNRCKAKKRLNPEFREAERVYRSEYLCRPEVRLRAARRYNMRAHKKWLVDNAQEIESGRFVDVGVDAYDQ